jgi:hypothetical protein
VKFIVKREAAGAVIGKAGANLKNIREITGCNSNFEKEVNTTFGGRILKFRHPDAGQTLLMSQAVYMALRMEGFSSVTQNDVRKVQSAPQAPPQYGVPQGPPQGYGAPAPSPYGDMGMGAAYGYGPAGGDVYGMPQNGGASKRFSPYGAKPDKALTCAYHGKKRGPKNLGAHPTNPSLSICLDGDPCRGVDQVSGSICSVHGKNRGAQNLQARPGQPGLFKCMDSDNCK